MADVRVYPSAFNPCILRCARDSESGGGSRQGDNVSVTLYMEHTFETLFVQLAFSDEFFANEENIFKCDLMEARDGGLPFLQVVDVLRLGAQTFSDVPYEKRHDILCETLQNPEYFDISSPSNEYRVRFPVFFSLAEVPSICQYELPNFYGVVLGFALTANYQERPCTERVGTFEDQNFVIQKTKLPGVYELFQPGAHFPVIGNNVAYIPNIQLAKQLRAHLNNRSSDLVKCTYDHTRQKWTPVLL